MVYLRKDCILREEYHTILNRICPYCHVVYFFLLLRCFRQQGQCRTDTIFFFVLAAVSFHLHPRLEGRHSHLKQMVNAFYVETQTHPKACGT